MSDEWMEEVSGGVARTGLALNGVAPAKVLSHTDPLNQGRVQLELPWLPGMRPWARVASVGAAAGRGLYSIPQPGDEVLVAFAHGDVADPYVLGSLWNALDQPPVVDSQGPKTRRMLKTPGGHVLDFDDQKQSVLLQTSSGHKIELTPEGITIESSSGDTIKLETSGAMSVTAAVSISLQAPQISIKGDTVAIEGSITSQLKGGATCQIQGGMVQIN